MVPSIGKLQSELMREYYRYFSKYAKGALPNRKVAWVTSFAPVEILEALDILYYYPESYAAVIAASGKEQEFLEQSRALQLTCDCCSYSCCMEGCIEQMSGPRGTPPKPDILIATNNQCSTLPNWWNILADRYKVPLIILDYPGETAQTDTSSYVTGQHRELIRELEKLSGNSLDMERLASVIACSKQSVTAWKKVTCLMSTRQVNPTVLFDDINYLITARCKEKTAELYTRMADEFKELPEALPDRIPIYWLGYPLWYHPDRYLSEIMDGFRISGSNYIAWWNLDYSGDDVFDQLYHAYNYTFLNLSQSSRNERLKQWIDESGAQCAVTLRNKSCKCDFVSARLLKLPQAELQIDMIDRTFPDLERARKQMEILKEIVCTK